MGPRPPGLLLFAWLTSVSALDVFRQAFAPTHSPLLVATNPAKLAHKRMLWSQEFQDEPQPNIEVPAPLVPGSAGLLNSGVTIQRAVQEAVGKARQDAITANAVTARSLLAHREAIAKKAEASELVAQLDDGMLELKHRLESYIQAAYVEKEAAAEAEEFKKAAEFALDRNVKAIPIIDKLAKEQLLQAKQEIDAIKEEQSDAARRKQLGKQMADTAGRQAAYYQELSDSLVQQQAAAQSAAKKMENALEAQKARSTAEMFAKRDIGYEAPKFETETAAGKLLGLSVQDHDYDFKMPMQLEKIMS